MKVQRMNRILWCLSMVLGVSIAAHAQGPAGNTHPEPEGPIVTVDSRPFGDPIDTGMTFADKVALAEAVDIEPLRDLAIYHNGRVKVLDTYARELVRTVTGRTRYYEFAYKGGAQEPTREGEKPEKYNFDPVFTLIDLVIDPGFYVDRPLLHVEYLPLRRSLLDQAVVIDRLDDVGRERLLMLGRLPVSLIAETSNEVLQSHGTNPAYVAGYNQLARADELAFGQSWKGLMMIAPESDDGFWAHLSRAEQGSELDAALAELGDAWRSGDAERANDAIARIASDLPTINSERYPTTRRGLELAYNQLKPFEWGMWTYAVSLVALLLAFGTGWRWLVTTGIALLFVGLALHTFGFTARCVIAERFAIQNQYESMTGLSLFAVVTGAVLMLIRRQWLFGAAASAVGFMVLIAATQTAIPGSTVDREAAILNTSVLLKYHVTTVLVSYGLISLGMVVSLFYLASYYAGRLGAQPGAVGGERPDDPGDLDTLQVSARALGEDVGEDKRVRAGKLLADLDKAQLIILQLAFWTLGVGVLLGAWWADHSWGRWWAFDPKETWALVTWIVYLIVVHTRVTTGGTKRGLLTAWLSVVGFIVMLWTYFGVNLLLPGLHAYA